MRDLLAVAEHKSRNVNARSRGGGFCEVWKTAAKN